MLVTVHGASDDLIEVRGDLVEEFSPSYDADQSFVAFSNGALLRVAYTDDGDGIWRITPLAGAEHVTVWQCPLDDPERYSDVATVSGPVSWVALATDYHAVRRPTSGGADSTIQPSTERATA